jgi:hypothetical protein
LFHLWIRAQKKIGILKRAKVRPSAGRTLANTRRLRGFGDRDSFAI